VRRRAGRSTLAALVTALVVATALGGSAAAAAASTRPAENAPGSWDHQVAPIAAKVEKLRGLDFDHPVPVHYLADAAFRKRVGVKASKLSRADRRKVGDLQATLRALGLIDANTDIVEALDAVQDAGVAAFYDPKGKEIVVRGKGALDVEHKVTLAHELTHVLQDQHFDLRELRRAASDSKTSSSGALTALVEGDAERIQHAYLKRLSKADQTAYDAAEAKASDSVESEIASAPELVKIELGAPYIFGPAVLDLLAAHGGNRSVDTAFRQGAPSDEIYLDPSAALRDVQVAEVATPPIPTGAHRIGKPDTIGPFDLFTVLASRIDRQAALSAADGWAGDRFVAYRSEGRVCARAVIAGTTGGASALTAGLRAWAAAMPAASVEAGPGPRLVTLTSCDTGGIAAPTADRTQGAVRLLATRNAIFTSAVRSGASNALAKCVAHHVVKAPLLRSSIDRDAAPSSEMEQELGALFASTASNCRATGRT
jgi:hypothetical protein